MSSKDALELAVEFLVEVLVDVEGAFVRVSVELRVDGFFTVVEFCVVDFGDEVCWLTRPPPRVVCVTVLSSSMGIKITI